MQKQKENNFQNKFRLLNSQEHTEDIIWSLSDSSDYEESALNERFNNITNKTRILKRKRKKRTPNNKTNLSITVLDTFKSSKELQNGETSPILVSKKYQKSSHQSPILASTSVLPMNIHQKSPIFAPKILSPIANYNVKKKLFQHQQCDHRMPEDSDTVKSEVDSEAIEENLTCRNTVLHSKENENTTNAKSELASKVKYFCDNHFGSESSSQNSQPISDTHSQKNCTKTSDEIEILTCKTHAASTNTSNSTKSIENEKQSGQSTEYDEINITKKVRYKKGGLAYRLNNLVKKQKACLSLWHHERFLAANSNFIIPKVENSVFRIQKVNFKYGCYLLECVDLDESDYLVLINNSYVTDTIISDTIIKIYEPFKVIQFNKNTKLLINVCRFECSQYKV